MFLRGNVVLKPLQIGEIMSNDKIMQFSYFYWNTNEKKADDKTTLFHDGICWKNVSWDTIRSSSGERQKKNLPGSTASFTVLHGKYVRKKRFLIHDMKCLTCCRINQNGQNILEAKWRPRRQQS